MEKKILTPDELKQFLLPASIAFPLGGLVYAALDGFVIFAVISVILTVLGWVVFPESDEEATKPNPINNNHQL